MPDAPHVGVFTRFVLENPYPLTIVLVIAAIALGWLGLSEGRGGQLRLAAGAAVLAAGVFLTGMLVTTPGEHAKALTRQFVNDVAAGRTHEALALVAPNAAFAIGSPQNPGHDFEFIRNRLAQLDQQYTIEHNRITSLRGFGEAADRATVHLTCRTEVSGGYGPVPSQWVLRVERIGDDHWQITQITAISIANRTPGNRLW